MTEVKNEVNTVSPVWSNNRGIKIVNNNRNKKDSDIFNLKKKDTYQNSQNSFINKQKIIEITEKNMDNKFRV